MRKIILVLMLLLMTAVGWCDEYVLVMSKEDNVCWHMLKLYNEDLKKYGKVKYGKHKEFNWIKWEEKTFKLRPVGGLPQQAKIENARVAIFDINNDSKNEVIVSRETLISRHPIDAYDIFPFDVLAMLNGNEVVEGDLYFPKRLKNIYSDDGVPVNIYDLSEENIKKLSEKIKYFIVGVKERGDKNLHFVGWSDKINFLRLKKHYYISFEGPRTIGPDESIDKVEHYSVVSELQKDNTLKNQCLYLINKDKSTKGRTR